MATPNSGKSLSFVVKVRDKDGNFKPIYVAPDATNMVAGDVKLSDSTSSSLDAATGMTAATPKAVKAAMDAASNKLDKTATGAQTVASDVVFSGTITANKFSGTLEGKASNAAHADSADSAAAASKLSTARTISVSAGSTAGSASFDGSSNVSITIPKVAATSIEGTIPVANLPQGALERLVKVTNRAARLALTTASVQTGDSVLQIDTGVMYIVVDDTKLASDDGYQEYKAGTSVSASSAESVPWNGVTGKPNYYKSSFSNVDGTILDKQIAANTISATMIKELAVGTTKIQNDAVTAQKIAAGAVTNGKIAAGAVSLTNLNDEIGTVMVGPSEPTDSHVKVWVKV